MSKAPGFTRCYGWVRVCSSFQFSVLYCVCECAFLCLFFSLFFVYVLCVVCPQLSASLDCSLLIADSVCLTTASFHNSYYLLKCRTLSYCFLSDRTLTDFLYQQQDNILGGVKRMFGFVLFIIGIVVHPNPHRIKSILMVNTKQCIIFALCVGKKITKG